jgi:predicted membrane-bound spermidine synthase
VTAARAARARWLLLAFLSGACVMVAELAAPRLVARHLGSSVLAWTTVIATFLGGLALGNAWGGRIADAGRRGALPLLLGVAGAALALTIPLDRLAESAFGGLAPDLRILVAVPFAFLPAAVALGTIAPVLGRAALRSDERPGRALGLVAAAGGLGGVAGTFVAGFALVPSFGTRAILLGTAVVVAASAWLALARGPAEVPRAAPPPPAPAKRAAPARPLRWAVLAGIVGAAILAVEIVAGRVAADRLGNSLYTWTSVIGVVLGGLAIGNAIGGRLADHVDPRRAVGDLLAFAYLAVGICLWTPGLMGFVVDLDVPWPARCLLAAAVGFLPASVALGSLSPALARGALADPSTDGRVVGRMYAAGSLGAVAGAVVSGFALIPWLGVPLLLIVTAYALAWAADLVTRSRQSAVTRIVLAVLAVLAALPPGIADGTADAVRDLGVRLGLREDREGIYVRDSRYYRVRVAPWDERWVRLAAPPDVDAVARDPLLFGRTGFDAARNRLAWDGPMSDAQYERLLQRVGDPRDLDAVRRLKERTTHRMRVLSLDMLVHGYVDLEDPTWLEYDYEVLYGAVVKRLWPGDGEVACFFVGGGAYTFQRRLLAMHGAVRCVTAEIDPAVTEAARRELGLEPDPRQEIVHRDARTAIEALPAGEYRFAFGDAFNDLSVPWHLTTREFAAALRSRLRPDGAYLVNVVDVFSSGRFLGAMLCTLESVFGHVRLLSTAPRDDDRQETFVLVASDRPLDLLALSDDQGLPLGVVPYAPEDLESLRRRAGRLVLTDDHAPVEALLAPVVRARASGR